MGSIPVGSTIKAAVIKRRLFSTPNFTQIKKQNLLKILDRGGVRCIIALSVKKRRKL